jgi:hypothetical protein
MRRPWLEGGEVVWESALVERLCHNRKSLILITLLLSGSARIESKRYSANGHCLFSWGQASNITSFLLVVERLVYGVSDLQFA